MPLGVSDSPMLVWVCACVRVFSMQRVWGVGRAVILSQWHWTHCVSSCRLLLMLLSYNSLFLALSVAHWPHSCHYLPLTHACGLVGALLQLYLCRCVPECMFVCLLPFVFLHECVCVCFISALTVHHGALREHCCISASLRVSWRLSKRPRAAGDGFGPENRNNREDRNGLGNKTKQCIKEQELYSKRAKWNVGLKEKCKLLCTLML